MFYKFVCLVSAYFCLLTLAGCHQSTNTESDDTDSDSATETETSTDSVTQDSQSDFEGTDTWEDSANTDALPVIEISDVTVWSNCQEFSGPYPLLSVWHVSFSNVGNDTAVLVEASLILEKDGEQAGQTLQSNLDPIPIIDGQGNAEQRIETNGNDSFFSDICTVYCQSTDFTLTVTYDVGESEVTTEFSGAFRCSG